MIRLDKFLCEMEIGTRSQVKDMIKKGQVDGIITLNMLAISSDEADAYYKVGKVKAAGGVMVTVDEGRLGMYINRGAPWEKN